MTSRQAGIVRRKPVVQLEPTGCGIASVAAIAGLSYSRARAIANSMGVFARDRALWSRTGYVRRLLRRMGYAAGRGETLFRSWRALPDLCLLSIKWHREKGVAVWHWVVFQREDGAAYVLDSKRSLRHHCRTDFGRMKPRWFIPVTESRALR